MNRDRAWEAYLRDGRFWGGVWLIGSLGLLGFLLWDARSWLAGSPEGSFRYTRLNEWPVAVIWCFTFPSLP